MKNITRISIAFSLVLLLAINMDGRLIAQTTKSPKQKRVHLNIRQIDFMNRVDSDLRRERSMNDRVKQYFSKRMAVLIRVHP